MLEFLSENEARILTKAKNQCDQWHVYANSANGRAKISAEQPWEMVAEVMAVWGDTPTVPDPKPMSELPPPAPTPEQQQLAEMLLTQAQQTAEIAQLQQANAALMLALAQTQTGGIDNVV